MVCCAVYGCTSTGKYNIDFPVMLEINAVFKEDNALIVRFNEGLSIRFEDCWLRDHCRCSTCYHASTFQRAHHILDIPEVTIVKFEFDYSELRVIWSDKHGSAYKSDFLIKFDYKSWIESKRLKPKVWTGNRVADIIFRESVKNFLNSVEGSKRVFQSLLNYGIAVVDGVDPSLEATETVCKALGGVQHTMFGGMWTLIANAERADTAYTTLPLAAHNDNTYFTEAAGLQIFHCLDHSNGTGGNTILVDGFYGALRLKEEHPEDYKFLTTFNLEAEFYDEDHHYTHSAPVIEINRDTGDIKQIRFNVYDRSAMAFPDSETCRAYYRSIKNLARYYRDPDNHWELKLKPGMVIAIDNFRVLHGRTEFSGNRTLCGSYVSRSDWLNKARKLQLIQ